MMRAIYVRISDYLKILRNSGIQMNKLNELKKIAQAMVASGKGILAADESTPTIGKRFATINTESTENSRRTYREMLFTADGVENYISGVIMYDETLRQSTADGTPFPKLLSDKGIVPGIKVDMGAKDLAGFAGEKWTQGLSGLRERLAEYYELGARFAKWRAVITIGDGIPSRHCLEVNAQALAAYSALCQEAGIVPIVEPEVLMEIWLFLVKVMPNNRVLLKLLKLRYVYLNVMCHQQFLVSLFYRAAKVRLMPLNI